MPEQDTQLTKWEGWIKGPITDSVVRMHWHRQIYRELIEIARLNRLRESAFWGYNFETYARSQAVAVRAQADRDRRSGSLARLIYEISEAPEKIDRDHWLGLWGRDDDGYAESRWIEAFGGKAAEHADPELLAPDLDVLPTDVVNAADRRPVVQGAVRPAPVVVAQKGSQSLRPLR